MTISFKEDAVPRYRHFGHRTILKECFSKPLYLFITLDAIVAFVSFFAGIFARWGELSQFAHSFSIHIEEALVFTALLVLSTFSSGLYHGPFRTGVLPIAIRILACLTLTFFGLAVILYAFPSLTIWRSAFLIAMICSFVGLLGVRLLFLRLVDVGMLKPRVLVLGTGNQARQIEELQSADLESEFTCMGYVRVDDEAITVPASRVLGTKDDLARLVADLGINEIVVALRQRRGQLPVPALLACRLSGIKVFDYMTFREKVSGCVDLDEVSPSWFIFADGFAGGILRQTLKRGFDILASVLFILFFMPLIIATAFAIRLEGPGPIFHRQERVGLGGRPFVLFKFRSMINNAERDGIPQWAARQDARITTVGAVIRKIRVDELPQLVNVLMGDMSFVGPRPERPFFVDQLAAELDFYQERHRVKPGITGWAQVQFSYGASMEDAKRKLEYDLYYVKNYNLLLDVLIVLQTVRVIIWPSGVR